MKLYIRDNWNFFRSASQAEPIKDLIDRLAKNLNVRVSFGSILVITTDDQQLIDVTTRLAEGKDLLLDLVDMADDDTTQAADTASESKIQTVEKGAGRLMVIEKSEQEPQRKPRQYRPRICPICGQEYLPTGTRSTHGQACPGAPSAPAVAEDEVTEPADVNTDTDPVTAEKPLPRWVNARTGESFENTELMKLVRNETFLVGTCFDHPDCGRHVVIERGGGIVLYPEKKLRK